MATLAKAHSKLTPNAVIKAMIIKPLVTFFVVAVATAKAQLPRIIAVRTLIIISFKLLLN